MQTYLSLSKDVCGVDIENKRTANILIILENIQLPYTVNKILYFSVFFVKLI